MCCAEPLSLCTRSCRLAALHMLAAFSQFVLSYTAFRKQKAGAEMQQTTKLVASTAAQRSSRAAADRHDDQDCLFLSGVRLHLCCCTPEEQLQLVRIAREGCALRHTDLSPGLTHIVVSMIGTVPACPLATTPTGCTACRKLSPSQPISWSLHECQST